MVSKSDKNDDLNDNIENKKNMVNSGQNQVPISNLSSLPKYILDWIENTSNEMIIIWDQAWNILYVSKSVEWLLGYDTSQLKGTSWFHIISEEDHYHFRQFDINAEENQLINIHFRHQDERNIYCECIIGNLQDEVNNQKYFISTIRDITNKKEIEEMMIRSEKMSIAGQLAAGIAHEIRNPLTAIKGFLQLLQAGVNRKDAYYKIMIDEIEKMETITSELLFISKPLTDHKQKESLIQMIDDVVALLKPQAKLRDINILLTQCEDQNIYCDRSQIKQVLINLIKNAVEAMDNPGTITIDVQATDSNIELNIMDEGPGIPEEVIHKLGEPFFTTKQSGTGLGLMITKQILERHNARMEILQNEHIGSTFRIIFAIP